MKNWIAYDKIGNELFFATAAKSKGQCLDKLRGIERGAYNDYLSNENSRIEISLFEVQPCQD